MRISCDYCLTEFDVAPPAGAEANPDQKFSFRCTQCDRVFEATFPSATAEAPAAAPPVQAPPPVQAAPPVRAAPAAALQVRQGEATYSLADQATLQRWILERRLAPEDLLSSDGVNWEPLGSRQDLALFFQMVEQVERAAAPPPAQPAPIAAPEPVAIPEPVATAVMVDEPEPEPEPVAVPEPVATAVVVDEPEPEPVAVLEPEPVADPEPAAEPEPQPEPDAAPEAVAAPDRPTPTPPPPMMDPLPADEPSEDSYPVVVEEEPEELFHDQDLEDLAVEPDPAWDDDKTMPPLSFEDVEQIKEAQLEVPEIPTESSDPESSDPEPVDEEPVEAALWDEEPGDDAPQDDEQLTEPTISLSAEEAFEEPVLDAPVVVREPSDQPSEEAVLSPPFEEEPAGANFDDDTGFSEEEESLFHVPDDDEDWGFSDDDDLAWNSGKKSRRKLVTAVFVVLLGVLGGAFFLTGDGDGAATDATATEGGEADAAAEAPAEAPPAPEEQVLDPEAAALAAEAEALAASEEAAIAAAEAEAVAAEQAAAGAEEPAAPAKKASKPAKKASKPAKKASKPAKKASKPRASGADGFVAAGREALKNGDYGQARMEFIEAVAMSPNSADANHGLAFAAHKQGDIGTAIRYYCTASRLASPGSSISREITSSLSNLGAVCE